MKDKTINLQFTTIKDPLPDFIYEGLKDFSRNANSYKPQPKELIEMLAKRHNIPTEMIYLTAGADEAIQMFIHGYGQNAYVFTPAYVVYSDVEEFGGKLNRIFSIEDDEYKVDVSEKVGATLIFLANPNNPSGFTPREKVMELVKNNPRSIVVIDEAYGDFADLSVAEQVKDFKNMVVLRSFSKGFGMAGNRIGYIIANPEIISIVKNKSQWSNVSYLSVGAAIIALKHEEYFGKMREDIHKKREEFMKFLRKKGYKFLPSLINAVLLKFEDEKAGTDFANYLVSKDFVISHGNGSSNIGLDKSYVRISIGTDYQMKSLMDVVEKYK